MVRHLFVASLGNPFPYKNTLHSAGHLVLDAVRVELGYPAFSRHVSSGAEYELFRSPAFMNDSGTPVKKAYSNFLADLPASERRFARLVVLHDELEQPLGRTRVKTGGSARGHNGLKSVAAKMGSGVDFVKIGIGIGRPESRDPAEVAKYVLRDASGVELEKIRFAAPKILDLLAELAAEE